MKKKIITGVVLATIAGAGMLGTSHANLSYTDIEERQEIREIMQKIKSGEILTTDEQTKFYEFKNKFGDKKAQFKKGKNGILKGLTDEEKEALKNMTYEERKTFFEEKKAERQSEMQAKKLERQSHEKVIDKLLAGEALTPEEEEIKAQIIEKRAERKAKRELMEKIKSGEELTDEEQSKLEEFKAKLPYKGKFGKKASKYF